MNTVAAVVVTFNRLELLKECIAALQAQTHQLAKIIVVNNGSTDGTQEWLQNEPGVLTITQENRGGAFGFYTGIKTAFEQGYEWIWCMDDDGVPATNALEKLMKYRQRKPSVMNTLVLDKQDHNKIVFETGGYTRRNEVKEEVIEGAANFFNGTLFHHQVVEKAGLPLKQLTIWGDETEYYNRIRFRHQLPVFTVSDSYHYHPAQYSRFYKRDWELSAGWKTYFYIRNKSFVAATRHQSNVRSVCSYLFFLTAFAGTIFVYQRTNKFKKMKLLVKAGFDGLKKDTSKGMLEVKHLLQQL